MATKLKVGDLVTYEIGPTTVRARVIEDRGPLGVGGRQIVRIETIPPDGSHLEPLQYEWPAEELSRVPDAA